MPAATAVQPPLSKDLNKLSTPGRPATKPHPLPVTSSLTTEKPPHGHQGSKQSKDKSKPRSNSQSATGKNNNWRGHAQHHQGSPPNLSNLPSQAERANPTTPPSTPTKANPSVRPALKIASRPTGKLARRRQNIGDAPSTPTPSKAMSVPCPQGQLPTWESHPLNLSHSVPSLSSIQGEKTRDVFPICDDLTDAEDDNMFAPSTPVHAKGVYNDGPRTAPLTNPHSGFLFNPNPASTRTLECKREHTTHGH